MRVNGNLSIAFESEMQIQSSSNNPLFLKSARLASVPVEFSIELANEIGEKSLFN